jgi:hypothetical protein
MSRAFSLPCLLLPGAALAHPGHGGLAEHLHASPEVLLLAALVAALAILRAR